MICRKTTWMVWASPINPNHRGRATSETWGWIATLISTNVLEFAHGWLLLLTLSQIQDQNLPLESDVSSDESYAESATNQRGDKGVVPSKPVINKTGTIETFDDYVPFSLADAKDPSEWCPRILSRQTQRNFSVFCQDSKLEENILEDLPVPSEECLQTPSLDPYLDDLFEAKGKSFEKKFDQSLQFIQKRILNSMGPLCHLWHNLDKIRRGESPADLDIFELLELVEKTTCLIGQANVSMNYNRRLNILAKLSKDVKKAKRLILKHDTALSEAKGRLFGDAFYDVMLKEVKRKTKAKLIFDAERRSARRPTFRHQGPSHPDRQPFQRMPSGGRQSTGGTFHIKPSFNRGFRGNSSRGRGRAGQSGRNRRLSYIS
ncbi:uncharacterized protein LOC124262422 [Haliotis rubra]|uniref:uncharacterized protein LOC124262422 n=1 Tax=Haliotis rubra TaxID=36100 RepID=UPI001EE51663|nr:uncharacterized protein LOC124262422 [Haliotis rubra]